MACVDSEDGVTFAYVPLCEYAFRILEHLYREEAYHLQTGENGVGRIIKRTGELMAEGKDPRQEGALPLDMIQRYCNFWFTGSMDLFGGEDSTNAAEAFAMGLKGRYRESDGIYKDPKALKDGYKALIPMRRWGVPAEVGGIISFLASEQAAFITGQDVAVNGGMTVC